MRPFFRLVFLVLFIPSIANAHPHSWIEQQTTILGDSQHITGLKMVWSFDVITTAYTLDGEDLSKAHRHATLQKVGASIIAHMLPDHFFTYFYRDGKPVRFRMVHEYHAAMPQKKYILYFTIPLDHPLAFDNHPLQLLIFDPSYYVDMYWDNAKSIHLAKALQGHCKLDLIKPHPTPKEVNYALSLPANADPDYKLGQLFTQKLDIRCSP
ncbi:DUF1007 family protein [Celerinatantimonas yamalensis]|uniref:DUF1007 family protein n=1 Tax=Celerinatantimonas yamalensis TaxID=559956 RepID=A0ABW9G6Z8_9GAMM